jgi:aspartate--ammonia ligase
METKTAYKTHFTEMETEIAISTVKTTFLESLKRHLNLIKVEAPIVVAKSSGMNDDLNGIEHPVTVNVKEIPEETIEIVHSLAKWKRAKLARLEAPVGSGIVTDMKALRPDESFSELHSIYVDQWDWEKVIAKSDRNLDYLQKEVKLIYQSILEAASEIAKRYPSIESQLPQEITFIHAEDLFSLYPELSPKERENAIVREHGAVFLIGIGGTLSHGEKHDGRAPDYDDWSTPTSDHKKGLNGDILIWSDALGKAIEVSSMGIRVDAAALKLQLQLTNTEDRLQLPWHQQLLNEELPYTIGGGIGQSRITMLLLKKKHVGEVQSSIWPSDLINELSEQNIKLL